MADFGVKKKNVLVGESIDENKEKGQPGSFSNFCGVSNSCGLEQVKRVEQNEDMHKNDIKIICYSRESR